MNPITKNEVTVDGISKLTLGAKVGDIPTHNLQDIADLMTLEVPAKYVAAGAVTPGEVFSSNRLMFKKAHPPPQPVAAYTPQQLGAEPSNLLIVGRHSHAGGTTAGDFITLELPGIDPKDLPKVWVRTCEISVDSKSGFAWGLYGSSPQAYVAVGLITKTRVVSSDPQYPHGSFDAAVFAEAKFAVDLNSVARWESGICAEWDFYSSTGKTGDKRVRYYKDLQLLKREKPDPNASQKQISGSKSNWSLGVGVKVYGSLLTKNIEVLIAAKGQLSAWMPLGAGWTFFSEGELTGTAHFELKGA